MTDRRTDEQKDGLKDGQALFYRTLPAIARGSIIIIIIIIIKTVMQHKISKTFSIFLHFF